MSGLRTILSFGIAFGLAGCATTTVPTVESDSQFHSTQLRRVMVINMGQDQALRARVEDEFVRQWNDRGVAAFASHVVLPAGMKLERGPVAAAAKAQKFDAVLVTRLLETQKIDPQIAGEEFEVAPSTSAAAGTRGEDKPIVASPQYAGNYRMAEVVTRIYDVQSEKRVWSCVSQTLVAKESSKLIKPFVKVVLDTLYLTP